MTKDLNSKVNYLEAQILEKIRSGMYPVGQKLPSIRALMQEFLVSQGTIVKVLAILHEKGVIRVEPKKAPLVLHRPAKYHILLKYSGLHLDVCADQFWGPFFKGICNELYRHPDYDLDVPVEYPPKNTATDSQKEYAGTIIIGLSDPHVLEKTYGKRPLIYVYSYPLNTKYSFVTTDFELCIQKLARQILQSGCKELGWCGPNADEGIDFEKIRLLKKYAEKYGISFRKENILSDLAYIGKPNIYQYTYDRVRKICTGKHAVDTIVLFSDQLYFPVLRAVYDSKKSVPQDIRIIGCDNMEYAEFSLPSLTTIELDRYQQGVLAVQELMKQIEHPETATKCRVKIPAKIIYRESFAERRGKNKEKQPNLS